MPGILDRYILKLFVKAVVVTFASLTGLFIVIDAFGHVEEFMTMSKEQGGLLRVLAAYYGPRALWFFDLLGPVTTHLAAIFAITTLIRSNELTAIMAGGVSKGRIVKPLIFAAVAVSLIGVFNREWWIPSVREKLMREAKDWRGQQQRTLRPTYDYKTDIFIGGRQTVADGKRILYPQFRLPANSEIGSQLAAEAAYYLPATADHPAGYVLDRVTTPEDIDQRPTLMINGEPAVITLRHHDFLTYGQCFVVSDVTFEQLAGGSMWRQLSSTLELMEHLRNPSLDLGNDARVMLHARMVQPLVDLTLFIIGLPVILRTNRNLFVAAGMSLGITAGFFIVTMFCHALGSNYIVSPALAAWLPLLIFSPAACSSCGRPRSRFTSGSRWRRRTPRRRRPPPSAPSSGRSCCSTSSSRSTRSSPPSAWPGKSG
jgi:lipopolysaccharide export system permease protein